MAQVLSKVSATCENCNEGYAKYIVLIKDMWVECWCRHCCYDKGVLS